MTRSHDGLGSLATVRLVARREIATRVAARSFKVGTALLVALVVLLSVAMKFITGGDEETTKVGLTPAAAVASDRITQNLQAFDQRPTVETIDPANARAAVADGNVDAVVDLRGDRFVVTVQSELDDTVRNALTVAANRVALDQQITSLGGNPGAVDAAVATAGVDVDAVDPPREFNYEQLAIGAITGILIFVALQIAGQLVAQGVVEEKSSRVVEVLLATVRPSDLLAGKVLGIGVVGLLQVALVAGAGLASGAAVGVVTLPAGTIGSTLGWLIVWFFLGYALYALAFAAAAALVSRQEDVGSVTGPLLILMILPYVIGISVLPNDPTNELARIMSLIPPFAPFLMPMRLAMGGVPAWEALLSLGLVAVLIPVLVVLSARVYKRAIVRTGSRVKLSDVLR